MSKKQIQQRWFAADEAFSLALKAEYGKRAGDMRYRPLEWTSETVKAAAAEFHRLRVEWEKAIG